MSEFLDTREVVERLKDIMSNEIDGIVFDWHVADAIGIPYSTMRVNILKNRLPLKEITIYCYRKEINLYQILFTNINKN